MGLGRAKYRSLCHRTTKFQVFFESPKRYLLGGQKSFKTINMILNFFTQFGSYQTHKNRHLNLLAPAISQDIAISQNFFRRKPYFGCLGSCYSALVLMHTEVCICLGKFSEYHQNSCTQLFIYKRPSHFRQKYSSVIAQP